ncbi:MAG TPA: helix-turn-helix domain-containing protein [Candidatus Moranbacteria bacterium]|nr:helix-turn-helix domain-containing protein [Candidatus Moranbacteria bacterium]
MRWVLPVYNREIRLADAVKVCPHSLERWLADYRKYGESGLKPKSTKPGSHPDETPIRIKERIKELRREKEECALKIKWDLEDEGIKIHKNTVHKIIKAEGLIRKYRTRES